MNTFDELLALFSGVRLIRIDTKSDLKYYAATLKALRKLFIYSYATTIDKIEETTGIDFFVNIEDELEEQSDAERIAMAL